jgi:homoprotocatechuate degradation regulator HpaR
MTDEQSAPGGRLRGFAVSLPMSLLRAREAAMQHFRPMLRSHGMTEQQWRVMRALSSKRTVEFSELVDMTFLLAPSMSRILKELEHRKLVSREVTDQDARKVNVSITAAGLKLIEKVAPHSEFIYAQISSRYGQKKLASLQAMLKELEEALSGELIELSPRGETRTPTRLRTGSR